MTSKNKYKKNLEIQENLKSVSDSLKLSNIYIFF